MPRPGVAPSWNRAPMETLPHGSYFGLCPCRVKCVSSSVPVAQTQLILPKSPNILVLAPSSSVLFSPPLPQFCVCLISSLAFLPHCSKAEQCLEPSWFGNAHGSVGRNAQHCPAPSTGLTGKSGRLDCKFQEFFALCSLVYGCLQGAIPAVLLFYARHLLAVTPCPATELHPGECEGSWAHNAGKPTPVCRVQNSCKGGENPWKRGICAMAAAELREPAHGFVVRRTGVNGNGHLP